MFWFFTKDVQRTWRGFFRPIAWVVFVVLIIIPLPYVFIDSSLAISELSMISILPVFGAMIVFAYINQALQYIGIDLDFLSDKLFQCSEYICLPTPVLGFAVVYVIWLILVCLIFLPLVYFLRKK